MPLSMEDLKSAFKNRNQATTQNTGFWDMFYPFYKMNFDEVASFRFLPDLDENNPWAFVVENKYHELTINGKKKRVACAQMHGEDCPICAASKRFYDLGDKDMGKTFWRKIDYVASGLVMSSPFEFKVEAGKNPVRLISLGPKLFETIEAALVSGDFDAPPYDLVDGADFRINKTKQGEYASYTTSAFARKATPVPENLLADIKLLNLKDYRYAKVDTATLEAMVEAVLTGKSFDEGKAAGAPAAPTAAPLKEAAPLQSAPKAEPAAAKVEAKAEEATAAGTGRAAEILARLRRNNAPAAA